MKLKVILSAILVLGLAGCNALENQSTSGSMLILVSLTGNAEDGTVGSTIAYSDVIKDSGGIVNDNGIAELTATLLDPSVETSTFYQDVVVYQVDVEYFRTDGLNTPGVHVPFPFSEPISILIPIGDKVEFPFTLVSHTAKMEAPLIYLRYSSTVLELVAKVTFYGKDVAGYQVEPLVGYITVRCGDFADSSAAYAH